MANVLIFENGRAKEYLESVHTPDYAKRQDVVLNPAMPDGVPLEYVKVENGQALEMTQGEKETVDSEKVQALANAANTSRNQALDYLKAQVDNPTEPWAVMQFVIGERTKEEIRGIKQSNPKESETDEQVKDDIKSRLESLKVN